MPCIYHTHHCIAYHMMSVRACVDHLPIIASPVYTDGPQSLTFVHESPAVAEIARDCTLSRNPSCGFACQCSVSVLYLEAQAPPSPVCGGYNFAQRSSCSCLFGPLSKVTLLCHLVDVQSQVQRLELTSPQVDWRCL